ncbi:T9SS type A sorting domain-containing protein [Chishuiella changwenlii]|uniref:T9SS type A sorting domain-containing protein n=1 Tax=Chishuiella changwenlii TaxID=1434701 RepID=UPI002FDB6696
MRKNNILFYIFFSFSSILFSQTPSLNINKLLFEFDEAGNQILRNTYEEIESFDPNEKKSQKTVQATNTNDQAQNQFFEHINFFPVPVEKDLSIKWDNEVNGQIASIGIYDHSQVNYFYKEIRNNFGNEILVNMSAYYSGIYIIQFTLTDGRVYSKSIIKK